MALKVSADKQAYTDLAKAFEAIGYTWGDSY